MSELKKEENHVHDWCISTSVLSILTTVEDIKNWSNVWGQFVH